MSLIINTKVKKMFYNGSKAKKAFLGSTLVWIGTVQITVPTVQSNPTYTGSNVSPTWNNYDPTKMTIGGTYSAIEIGNYTATFTPKEGYSWDAEGEDISTKSVGWSIAIPDYLCFTANTAGSTVKLSLMSGTPTHGQAFEYSTDGVNYYNYTIDNVITLANIGDKVYWRGNNITVNEEYLWEHLGMYYSFIMTGSIAGSGNLMSLLDKSCRSTTISHECCFCSLFEFCDALTSAPSLPATIISDSCYTDLYRYCTNLTEFPRNYLSHVTELKYDCFHGMFGRTAITTPIDLPWTTLANKCYRSIFDCCSALTLAPALPATTLAPSCYAYMFNGCSALKVVTELPATVLAEGCYQGMFSGCTSLIVSDTSGSGYDKQWKIPTDGNGSGDYTMSSMFSNCAGTRSENSPNFNGIQKIYYTQNKPIASPEYLNFTANTAGSTVALNVNGTPTKNQSFQYSTDKITWTNYIPGTTGAITLITVGDTVYFKATNTNSTVSESYSVYYNFVMSGSISGSGNVMSLLDQTYQSKTVQSAYCFYRLFYNCVSLTSAPEFPATALTDYCYSYTFQNCTSLTTTPILPATTLAEECYKCMFYNCTSLNTVSDLPATTLKSGCYKYMFYKCASLITAPILPATTLASNCYTNMLEYCTSLVNPPVLPATELAEYCYYAMFKNCTSLVNSPVLPATTLASNCYTNMLEYCTSLVNPPVLPATELAEYCYYAMFKKCTSLVNSPVLPATTLASHCYANMFSNCSSLATAPELPATTLEYNCYSYMFHGCKSLTSAPILSATELAYGCYSDMFNNCTSLVNPPVLPATELSDQCYANMFQNCTSLTTAPALPATELKDYCYYGMFYTCMSLTTAPSLPATSLSWNCYGYMFYSCTKLTTIPNLPATALKYECYSYMFAYCTSLYVSDTYDSLWYNKTWKIPQNGKGTSDYEMDSMFIGCRANRSTDSPIFDGVQKTYYTQNPPI